MAKVKYGEMISDMRGKINGTVHSKNTYGQYMRNKVTPVNPSTTSQAQVRSQFGENSQAWRGLTDSERGAWEGASNNFLQTNIFGDSFKYTGFNLFMRVNRWLQTISEPTVTTPPIPTAVTNSMITALTANGTTGVLTATYDPAIPVDHRVIVRATAPQSAGKKFVRSEYRQIDVLDSTAISPQVITVAYNAKFGSIIGKATMKVFVEFQPVTETGIPGVASSVSAIIS